MAIFTVRHRFELGPTFVLAPERYDPRRDTLRTGSASVKSVALGSVAICVKQTINPQRQSAGSNQFVVFDTSDIREGLVIGRKTPISMAELGSSKKRLQGSDVLISRLRPYLRQVAFVDNDIRDAESEIELVCSTEFFVLRSISGASIAFLVPFLLSGSVQKVLSASQEGGHHPRFGEDTLLRLPIPQTLAEDRERLSAEVIHGIGLYRQRENALKQLIATAENAITAEPPADQLKRHL
jgi:hypothetical protein